MEDALVLLIRERALLVNDQKNNLFCTFNSNSLPKNNSFISKYSVELFDAFREINDDSNMLEIGSNNNE